MNAVSFPPFFFFSLSFLFLPWSQPLASYGNDVSNFRLNIQLLRQPTLMATLLNYPVNAL